MDDHDLALYTNPPKHWRSTCPWQSASDPPEGVEAPDDFDKTLSLATRMGKNDGILVFLQLLHVITRITIYIDVENNHGFTFEE